MLKICTYRGCGGAITKKHFYNISRFRVIMLPLLIGWPHNVPSLAQRYKYCPFSYGKGDFFPCSLVSSNTSSTHIATCTDQRKSLQSSWLLDTSLQTLPDTSTLKCPYPLVSTLPTRHTATLYHGWRFHRRYSCRPRDHYQCDTCFRDRRRRPACPEDDLQSPASVPTGAPQNRKHDARASDLVGFLPICTLHLYTNNEYAVVVPMASH